MNLAEPPKKIYWDACAWIGFVNSEANKIHPLRAIWEEARAGNYEIWTNSYVYVEVFKVKRETGDLYSPQESDEIIESILIQPHVKRVQMDTPIAKGARDLRRSFDANGLRSRPDAIHLSTAIFWNVEEFHTWDKQHLLGLNGSVFCRNGKPLVIKIPGPEVMGPLFGAAPPPDSGKLDEEKKS
jgi:predicted nucleic acid-binding protein